VLGPFTGGRVGHDPGWEGHLQPVRLRPPAGRGVL